MGRAQLGGREDSLRPVSSRDRCFHSHYAKSFRLTFMIVAGFVTDLIVSTQNSDVEFVHLLFEQSS